MILFDIDNTLVYGEKASIFYRHYSRILEKTLAQSLGVDLKEGIRIANEHRKIFNGQGEKAFETYTIPMETWYDALCLLDPDRFLEPLPSADKLLRQLKEQKIIVGAITDGPRAQVERILSAVKINIGNIDFIIGWERGKIMPKYGSSAIFEKVCAEKGIPRIKTVMVGDSLGSDVLPALLVGLKAIYISDSKDESEKRYITLKNIEPLINFKIIL